VYIDGIFLLDQTNYPIVVNTLLRRSVELCTDHCRYSSQWHRISSTP